MEYVLGFLCLFGFLIVLDCALGEDDTTIPRDVVRRKGDR